jgi:site-specific DNA-methyltransferase (adenine-specific)
VQNIGSFTINEIHCGDSAVLLKQLPSECIDLTVTSPPYDNLRKYKGFTFDFETIASQLYRVTKSGGVVVWVVGDATVKGSETLTSFKQAIRFQEIGFNVETMIYEKAQACFGSNQYYLQAFEYMFVLSKGKSKTVNFLRDRKNKRSGVESMGKQGLRPDGTKAERHYKEMKEYGKRKNIWQYGVGGGKSGHPAVFPEALASDHILSWSNENDLVLDCFAGSGTTLRMAKKHNRNYIGFEISDEYCSLAKQSLLMGESLPNKACSGRVGLLRAPSIIHT